MKQFFLWFLFMAVGGALMYRSYPIMEMFGKSTWAEQNLWGTRNLIYLGGFALIIVGGLIMFGMVQMSNPTDSLPELSTV